MFIHYLYPTMLFKIYQWFQALSLDVVAGSIILSLAIAKYLGVDLESSILVSLGIAVWIIYSFDHLLDARKVKKTASSFRHRIYQKYFKKLTIACFIATSVEIFMLFQIPSTLLYNGLFGILFVALYFVMLRTKTFWLKETFVAVGYTMGVFIGPLSLLNIGLSISQCFLIAQISLIAFSNLLLFSWFDFPQDKTDGHYSAVFHFGLEKTKRLVIWLIVVGMFLCCVQGFLTDESGRVFQFVLLLMNAILFGVIYKSATFQKIEGYKAISDGIFYLPAFYLLIN